MNKKYKVAVLSFLLTSTICANFSVEAVSRDAVRFRGHYYKVYDRELNWEEAADQCEEKSGHLVTITSEDEQEFIEELLHRHGNKHCYWLGGYKDRRGTWRWVTNETPHYSNWAKAQPDNFTGKEDTLMMYRHSNPTSSSKLGQWNDIHWTGNCNGEAFFGVRNFGFICEWDSDSESYTRNNRYDRYYYDDSDYYDDDDDYYDDRNRRRHRRDDKSW